jgi:hypothetical protein
VGCFCVYYERCNIFCFTWVDPHSFAIAFKFSHQLVDIVVSMDGVQTLADVIIIRVYLL